MYRKLVAILILFICFLIVTIGCKKDSTTDFTPEEKQLYDSLKIIAFKDMRSNTDIICGRAKDSLFNIYVDSLMNLRRAEIEQLFEK